jgi:hypothetical protein
MIYTWFLFTSGTMPDTKTIFAKNRCKETNYSWKLKARNKELSDCTLFVLPLVGFVE